MAHLSFFIAADDLPILIDRLNRDDDVGYLVWQGEGMAAGSGSGWRVMPTVETLSVGEHALWHACRRQLPLVDRSAGAGQLSAGPPEAPDFGAHHPAAMRLTLWPRHLRYTAHERRTVKPLIGFWADRDVLPVSDIQSGNRFEPVPKPETYWFARFKRWMARTAVKLEVPGWPVSLYAFPCALALLKQGVPYYAQGLRLDAAIAQASVLLIQAPDKRSTRTR